MGICTTDCFLRFILSFFVANCYFLQKPIFYLFSKLRSYDYWVITIQKKFHFIGMDEYDYYKLQRSKPPRRRKPEVQGATTTQSFTTSRRSRFVVGHQLILVGAGSLFFQLIGTDATATASATATTTQIPSNCENAIVVVQPTLVILFEHSCDRCITLITDQCL